MRELFYAFPFAFHVLNKDAVMMAIIMKEYGFTVII